MQPKKQLTLILAMLERKRFFSIEAFPNTFHFSGINHNVIFMGLMHFWFLFRTNEESMSVCNTCYVCMSEHMPDLKLH